VRSADRALALSIAADYSQQGGALSPERYARRTLAALPGYRRLRVGRARALRGTRYPGVEVPASGTYRPTGVRQDIRAIALQRRGVVTFSLLVFRNTRVPGAAYRAAVDEMVRTLRSQPPQP
jgi:hypothetical protein